MISIPFTPQTAPPPDDPVAKERMRSAPGLSTSYTVDSTPSRTVSSSLPARSTHPSWSRAHSTTCHTLETMSIRQRTWECGQAPNAR
ncbi:hypothetical protein BD626DRAFT_496898 [Schizophyllum amplum]|uniref:Uncharacterized protein n=1 Tax=Schizophyllum amplum TaxID=97359 RepID=A0A550CDK5_9AGAR|nr:hypothetical protein BD626DRAFT_496898 [Auriculariopsis ampla]